MGQYANELNQRKRSAFLRACIGNRIAAATRINQCPNAAFIDDHLSYLNTIIFTN